MVNYLVLDGDLTVTLKSIEEILTYHDPEPLVVKALHLSWRYIIDLPDKELPEKQEIDVSFYTSHYSDILTESDTTPGLKLGYSQFTISYSSRTWGADIENILSKHLRNKVLPERPLNRFFRRNGARLISIMLLLLATTGMLLTTISLQTERKSNMELLRDINNGYWENYEESMQGIVDSVSNDVERIHSKLDYVIQNELENTRQFQSSLIEMYIINDRPFSQFSQYPWKNVLFVVLFAVSVFIMLYGFPRRYESDSILQRFFYFTPSSNLLLNNPSIEYKKQLDRKNSRKYFLVIFTIVFEILLGIGIGLLTTYIQLNL